MYERRRVHYLLMGASTVSLGLFLTSLIGDHWIVNSKSAADYNNTYTDVILKHRGLWQGCFLDGNCKRLDLLYHGDMGTKWLQACRISVCIGTFLPIFGFIAAVFEPCYYRFKLHHSGTSLLVGPFCWLLGMAIYTGFENRDLQTPYEWGWSFIIGWFATFFLPIISFPLAWSAMGDD